MFFYEYCGFPFSIYLQWTLVIAVNTKTNDRGMELSKHSDGALLEMGNINILFFLSIFSFFIHFLRRNFNLKRSTQNK
jgi:hypothetical protein